MALRIELFPADMDRFVDFYCRVLRFQLVRDERAAELPYASAERGAVKIGALKAWKAARVTDRRPPLGVEIVLEVDDLDTEYSLVCEAGWSVEEPITKRPWGLQDFRLLDPDGYYIRVTSK